MAAFGIEVIRIVFLRVQLDKTLHVDHQTAMSCVGFWLRVEPLECLSTNGRPGFGKGLIRAKLRHGDKAPARMRWFGSFETLWLEDMACLIRGQD